MSVKVHTCIQKRPGWGNPDTCSYRKGNRNHRHIFGSCHCTYYHTNHGQLETLPETSVTYLQPVAEDDLWQPAHRQEEQGQLPPAQALHTVPQEQPEVCC